MGELGNLKVLICEHSPALVAPGPLFFLACPSMESTRAHARVWQFVDYQLYAAYLCVYMHVVCNLLTLPTSHVFVTTRLGQNEGDR